MNDTIDSVVELLENSRSLFFITGAGISADSGLPTYRGIGGLYDVDDPDEGIPIEVILSGEMYRTRPELTWKYLGQIAAAARGTRFNRAHEVIAEMENHFDRVCTLTQNVDGFHSQAGSTDVIEIHGNMHRLSCPRCAVEIEVDEPDEIEIPPRCEHCQSILRPQVVLFGEMLPPTAIDRLHAQLERGCDAVFSVGTSSLFPYISQPVVEAQSIGAATIEINPGETDLSNIVDYRIAKGAAEALDELWLRYLAKR